MALGYFIQDIEQRIPIDISWYNLYNLPMLHTGDLMLAQVMFNDMQTLPPEVAGPIPSIIPPGWLPSMAI
jgi:hypothetical protein